MARITISDLYPSSDEQHITELTPWEAKKVEAGTSSSTITIDTSSLIEIQQNLNSILRNVSDQLQQTFYQQQQQSNNGNGRRPQYDDYYDYY
ncbi:MAG: hypothetical protein KAF91_16530 [Nostoc sp. TH1S01]|nr:hypothetical protein [Nostoc sp. TH1S01]